MHKTANKKSKEFVQIDILTIPEKSAIIVDVRKRYKNTEKEITTMTIFAIMDELEACGDATVWAFMTDEGMMYHVTLEDFEGFDDDWDEVYRDYEREDLVETFLDTLDKQALRCDKGFYKTYYFDGFGIKLGYASYDI